MPSFDERQAQNQLPHLLDFIAGYLRNQLGTPLESFLPTELFKTASRLLKDWEAAVQGASARAAAEGSVLGDTCPLCGALAVISARPEARAYCHLCKCLFYRYEACTECSRPTLSRFSPEASDNFCDECMAAAGDRYAQMWFDIQRGQ
jgi:hypothetical protein